MTSVYQLYQLPVNKINIDPMYRYLVHYIVHLTQYLFFGVSQTYNMSFSNLWSFFKPDNHNDVVSVLVLSIVVSILDYDVHVFLHFLSYNIFIKESIGIDQNLIYRDFHLFFFFRVS
uniref:Uncharacterized protein n=1 Tax=Cacopsylla melanoneura TaxID=428564 RepID=A0A8D8YUH2_9HEMI